MARERCQQACDLELADPLASYLLDIGADELVAFDVWWVQDKSPKPGQLRGQPLPPQRLTSYGYVKDSGAKPWLTPKQPRQGGG